MRGNLWGNGPIEYSFKDFSQDILWLLQTAGLTFFNYFSSAGTRPFYASYLINLYRLYKVSIITFIIISYIFLALKLKLGS